MISRWKRHLLYATLIMVGGGLIFILIETVKAKNTGFEMKTLWDWMELLIIPFVLAIGAFVLNRSERAVERQTAADRAKLEREIAGARQQEAALQAYIDRMSELLLKEKLRTTKKAEVRDVARTRTISVMRVLDLRRNKLVIQFLLQANLINSPNSILKHANMEDIDLRRVILRNVNLEGSNLQDANLQRASLDSANLQGAYLQNANLDGANLGDANLDGAILDGANLDGAFLWKANLDGANLQDANLRGANLRDANLRGAILHRAILRDANLEGAYLGDANLEGSNLRGANLRGANLEGAYLWKANLDGANLQGATVTEKQLAEAKSLKGATMPDGTKHE